MTNKIDIVELAHEIAEIARTTTDPETGRLLIELVNKLLSRAVQRSIRPAIEVESGMQRLG
jgi:hypothetical protein